MESVKKWLNERHSKRNGIYVHYSPPKMVDVASSAQFRQWARGGAAGKLERAILAGQGRRLLAELPTPPVSHLPQLVARCEALHAALEKGSLLELQELLESDYNRKKHVTCCDESGTGLLHKAVYYDFMDIVKYLVSNFPELVHQRDSEGRTPLHYAALCRDPQAAWAVLERAGAARGARDAAGHAPAYYRGAARTQLTLPQPDMPPDPPKHPPGLVIKRHNIRIWFHDCDMAKLQRMVWEGHGSKLLAEVSNQPVVKKFLEAVPYIMNTIRDIHHAVIENDLEGLMRLAGEPVPGQILSSRDSNNMTVMHKVAGLGHGGILGYIADRYPQGINDIDNDGRTPLHYAAAVRDDQHMYNTLVSLGADESAVDNKNRTPGYYINRPQEIDKSLLHTLPDAPRTPSSAYPASWDWKLLDTEAIVELNKKSRRKNHRASNENISSKNNSNSISENTNSTRRGMKNSSTQELIRALPELDDRKHNGNHKDSDEKVVEENGVEKDEDQTEEEIKESGNEATEIENNEPDINEPDQNNHDEKSSEETEDAELANNDEDNSQNDEDVNDHEAAPDGEDVKDEAQEPSENIESDEGNESNTISDAHENDDERNEQKVDKNNDENKENETNQENNEETQENEKNNIENASDSENKDAEPDENPEENEEPSTPEGNKNHEHNEDDDDVHVQGDSHSEYSDTHQRSTAEATDTANAKRGNEADGRNTQESLIEGIISGDAEQDSQDASIQKDETVQGEILVVDSEIDPEIAELINTANMEMLAQLVLNGEGSRLVGRRAANMELQSFLNNVPTYMQKINKVHLAAREGNIKDLQSALDRRKFAIARDPISPNGATPLHVATVCGKTNIMKYLGGRFPETLSAVDFEGRTALHYAAVLPDNGHYYNLLQQLGANSKDLDDTGRTAEDYYKNPNILPYTQLLADFGIDEDMAQSMLSDKGSTPANGHMDIPMFKTDEGRYLAKSLGDPLIKGLTEVANVKPKDPVAFLASFLQNFPDHEKPRIGTEESNVIVTRQAAEVENESPPPGAEEGAAKATRSAAKTAVRPHRPIDVVTIDPQPEVSPDAPEAAFSSVNRDEHGQSMLHFAAARTHTRNALFQLLQESDISLGYRDELYRTARDVSLQANVLENTAEIDRWVLHLAARGNTEKIMHLLLEGYDHILDVVDDEGTPITEVVAERGDSDMVNLLASIPAFEEQREALHGAVRRGDLKALQAAVNAEGGRTLARGMNSFGRTALHVAVLAQHEEIVDYLAEACPELLRIGDNLERTPLHYAMGVEKMESLSRILIRAGAKRVLKDLKGRQPSYYFMNKSDILRLKEEEDVY